MLGGGYLPIEDVAFSGVFPVKVDNAGGSESGADCQSLQSPASCRTVGGGVRGTRFLEKLALSVYSGGT